MESRRTNFDYDKYYKSIMGNDCLFCLLAKNCPNIEKEHFIYIDKFTIVLLDRYPTQNGYCLVFPKKHVEQISELNQESYLRLQSVVHMTIRAVKKATGAERVYTACLGSKLIIPHIHYHVVPIPPGLKIEDQQWNALDKSRGIVPYSKKKFSKIADKIRTAFNDIFEEHKV